MTDATSIGELLAQVRAMTAEVDAATAAQREARKADAQANAKALQELAAKRRAGELGRDWQVLQQRIDMNQTTQDDILNGVDLSAEAKAVRLQIQRDVIPRARAQFADAMNSEELATHLDDLHRAQDDLKDALVSIQRMGGAR